MARRVVHAVLVSMLASWASIATGHDTWLLPARFDLPPGGRIVIDLLAKTFVRVGQPTADQSWREPVGLALEIVPLADPTTLRVGNELSVRVLRDAKPLPRFSVSAVSSATNEPIMRSTDGNGRAVFTLDRPGPWLLRGTLIEPSSSPDADWQSLFATLTVRVEPAP
jgi:uncharacterized GH25 family protein